MVIISSVLRTLLHLVGIPLLREEDLDEKGDPLSAFFRSKTFGSKTKDAKNPIASWPVILIGAGSIGIGAFTWFHFTFFHTVHALLMSFFLQMEPKNLFGPNGFINADKMVVFDYLITHYWPMILGTFIARRGIILAGNPGLNLKVIYQGVVRIHVFILLSAFFVLLDLFRHRGISACTAFYPSLSLLLPDQDFPAAARLLFKRFETGRGLSST